MKLTVLVDNNTYIDQYYYGEPALSFYIQQGDKNILFDAAYSDILVKNAQLIGVDLSQTDCLALSHGHEDHTVGLKYLGDAIKDKTQLVCHPDCLLPKQWNGKDIGSPYSEEQIAEKYSYTPSAQPVEIAQNLWFLGGIPRIFPHEKSCIGQIFKDGQWTDDHINEDTALVYKGKDGLFVITGCSHSGICNICEWAKQVCKEDKIHGIIGGFHLFDDDEKLAKTVEYFVANGVEKLYPCHCVSLVAKHRMMEKLDVAEVATGLVLEIE